MDGTGAKARRQRGRRAGGTTLVVLIGVALMALLLWASSSGLTREEDGSTTGDDPSTTVAHVPGDCHRGADEYRPELEVVVDARPLTGLEDGSTVTVGTDCLGAGASAQVVVCIPGPTEIYRRCDTGAGSSYTVPASGVLEVDVTVARVVTPGEGDAVDCAAAPGTCVIAIASFEDEWGEEPLTFRSGLGAVGVERRDGEVYRFGGGRIRPEGPVAVGGEVSVTVTGFEPNEDLVAGLCSDAALQDGLLLNCMVLTQGALDLADEASSPPLAADATGAATYTTAAVRAFRPTAAAFATDDDADEDGVVGCTDRAGRCLLVVAAAIDLQRLAVFPLTVEG